MKGPDLDRERCERKLVTKEFLATYNEDLPAGFPQLTAPLLETFFTSHPELFKQGKKWSLDQHRKKVMDWLPGYVRSHAQG